MVYNYINSNSNWPHISMHNNDLNKIDRNILRELQKNARISYAELARTVGLTTSPCIDRVKKLEKQGYIQNYQAQLNPQLLGAGLVVFVQLRLERTSRQGFDDFQQAILKLAEVQECYLVSGNFDYFIKARVADMAAYRKFLGDTLLSVPGVAESTSIVAMEAIKETLTIDIDTD